MGKIKFNSKIFIGSIVWTATIILTFFLSALYFKSSAASSIPYWWVSIITVSVSTLFSLIGTLYMFRLTRKHDKEKLVRGIFQLFLAVASQDIQSLEKVFDSVTGERLIKTSVSYNLVPLNLFSSITDYAAVFSAAEEEAAIIMNALYLRESLARSFPSDEELRRYHTLIKVAHVKVKQLMLSEK